MQIQNKEKILSIDMLRFLAAFGVMLYHYVFMFTQRGYTTYDYGKLLTLTQYGYLGVDLFFIISGFVIAMSAENRSLFEFVKSRILRLCPLLWICVSLASIVILFFGENISTGINIGNYLANLTMVPFQFGGYPIDGSYWSLTVELKFYIIIGLILSFGFYKKLENLSYVISLILAIGSATNLISFNWVGYFIAGIIFFNIHKYKLTLIRFLSVVSTLIPTLIYAISRTPDLSAGYHKIFESNYIVLHIIIFYLIFFFISTHKLDNFINKLKFTRLKKLILILGSLTYPIYLLHQVIGHIAILQLEEYNINVYVALFLTVLLIILTSYILVKYVEIYIKSFLHKLFNIFEIKFSKYKILNFAFRKD